ncbi:hypothetical protein KUCAC02_020840 [Chaenocephalus aceratus]|uniref:Uncharacterized protein n=1 Tax=Chaenocephalus aceratus TaxID=36190 RepID=A0ACB9XFU7_CHAAC|nr:hypothetical protein KUCAC02_020840 [Chaenocephalus aceratus]
MPALTLFVGSLPASASNERLEEIFSEIGPVKQCFVVRDKGTEKCRGFGYVTFSMEEDAQRAMKDVKEFDGKKLSISVAKKKIKDKRKTAPKEPAPAPAPKENEEKTKGIRKTHLKARLIIRNLSFKCSEDDLKEVFSKFGTVRENKIALKPDGKMRGFAFVQFKNVSEAAKALTAMNLKEIKGRQVAIDWAVPKDKFIATQSSASAGAKVTEATAKPSASKSDSEDEEEEKPQAAPAKKKVTTKPEVEESQSGDEDDSEEQDSEEEADDEKEDDDVSQEGDDDEDKSNLDSEDDQDESEGDEDDEDDEESAKKKKAKKLLPSDVPEGRTIFLRNLSFDTEEEDLEEILLKYGELNYIKVVLHPDTGHSKGCAFAQFKNKEAADKCLAASQDEAESAGIRLDGRKLMIVAAVTREDASKLKVDKVKVETGTRNLYLAREGLIRAGTKPAENVPEADMAKRTRFEEIRRPSFGNRLCVHNLPKSVDNKKLKALCLQAVKGDKGVRINECRVMYDKKPEKGQSNGQSLGYGFVQFQEHEHALSTLRYLNNNPDLFGSHKRPIVEFSLEDTRKLKLKEIRQQRNKEFLQNRLQKGGGKPQAPADGKMGQMRDKGKPQAPPPKKARPGTGRKDRQKQQIEKPTQPRNQKANTGKKQFKRRDGDRFDSLVEQYKKKLMGNGDKNTDVRKNKWFDS